MRKQPNIPITLVWTPDSSHCRLPEEIPGLAEPIIASRKQQAQIDHTNTLIRFKLFTIGLVAILAMITYRNLCELGQIEVASGITTRLLEKIVWLVIQLASSISVGFLLLGYLTLVLIPWYQARKDHTEIIEKESDLADSLHALRFETWLSFQKAPITRLTLITIFIVFFFQTVGDQSAFALNDSIHHAGLVKAAYFNGEIWRLLTAPMLHGGLLHFTMNALALLYLGKRMELFARWPHLPVIFLISAIAGGIASAHFTPATSVGSSGGLMGWLGFLLVFETLHQRLVPKTARRRLLGGLFMTAVIGLIGYRFIDNAAHFGGLLAGMTYAAIVFPKSTSPIRPNITLTDRIVGSICLMILFLSCGLAVVKILT
jgi:membrane associated rhomboid family serine protease